MLDTASQFIANVAASEFGKTVRRSARTAWNAQVTAFSVTREEAVKVFAAAADALAPSRKPQGARKATRRSASRAAA